MEEVENKKEKSSQNQEAALPSLQAALYLIPVTLGETSVFQVLPGYNHDIITGIR